MTVARTGHVNRVATLSSLTTVEVPDLLTAAPLTNALKSAQEQVVRNYTIFLGMLYISAFRYRQGVIGS